MKNLNIIKVMVILGSLFLTSCGGNTEVSSNPSIEASSSEPFSYQDVDDAPLVDSGDYIVNKLVYHIDKGSKKLTVLDYDMDFYKYTRNQGETVAEHNFKFVKYIIYDSIYYQDGGKDYFIYYDGSLFQLANVDGGTTVRQSIHQFPRNLTEPDRPAIYISDKQTQNNEDFYLFLRLRSTYAALYVGTRTEGWDAELGYINDFKYSYDLIGMMIQIPHAEDDGRCKLSVVDNDTIRFSNSSSKEGAYSCTGTFTFLAWDHE